MANIFILSSPKDQSFTDELKNELLKSGHQVFGYYSPSELSPVARTILLEHLQKIDVVIILLSEFSVGSRNFMAEIETAIGYSEQKGKPQILPILLDAEVEVPPSLYRYNLLEGYERNAEVTASYVSTAAEHYYGQAKAKEEERKETIERVEQTAASYIELSLKELRKREKTYYIASYIWYIVAFLSLIGGLVFAIYRALSIGHEENISWTFVVQFAILNLIIVGMLGAVSRFSFILGKAFMVESLRNADRTHAISFGEFYLKAFGDKSEWTEVKEAFQHWNIDKGSAFSQQTVKDIDPEILQAAIEIAKSVSGKKD